jgi:metal-responsive CopG/Arc/MetJ family transcriptional regulator
MGGGRWRLPWTVRVGGDVSRYIYRMRVKASVTLPEALLAEIDRIDDNRSAFLERAALAYLGSLEKSRRDARDLEILQKHAEYLNAEAKDVLEYQAWSEEER